MGIFSKKGKNDFIIEEEADDEYASAFKVSSAPPAHMLTPDEILSDFGKKTENIPEARNSESGALEKMKQRMLKLPQTDPEIKQKSDIVHKSENHNDGEKSESHIYNKDGIKSEKTAEAKASKNTDPGSSVDFMSLFSAPEKADTGSENRVTGETLLDKCMPYILDDDGNNAAAADEPLYTLESVADILRNNSNKALEQLSRKYGVSFEATENKAAPDTGQKNEAPSSKNEFVREKSEGEAALPKETAADDDLLIFDDKLPQISDIDNNIYQPPIPDISNHEEQATIRFTPIHSEGEENERISVSTSTRSIDITGELTALSSAASVSADDMQLEQSEFEAFNPSSEPKNPSEIKKLVFRYSKLRRRAFLQTVMSVILLALSAVPLFPVFSDFIIRSPGKAMLYSSVLLAIGIIINLDMFTAFGSFFGKYTSTDVPAALSALSILTLGIYSSVINRSAYGITVMALLILAIRSYCRFKNASTLCGNLRQAFGNKPKKAVTLITDEATAFAMAKNAIDGDALIASPRSIDIADDFMKYAEYTPLLGGKLSAISLTAFLLAVIFGFAAASFFRSAFWGLYIAVVLLSAAAGPTLFGIEVLPLAAAAARLNKKGSMIAGRAAANRLELANAAVVSSNDIFPIGTVELQNMKVLSENCFDENILRAASLTEAAGSPLAPIFKKIAGTGSGYIIPDSETVKYEDKLGISGWVGDELMFIGNRTLMQAHGISVPDIEVDRKILRRGYFPVYLGVGDKACALLAVSYNVNPRTAYELRQLTNLGVTLLVNNCDPNLTEEMLCDYFGLYSDSVKVMNNSGVHMYRNAVVPCKRCSAPAVFRGDPLNFILALTCASRIKRSIRWLSVLYAVIACVGSAVFVYLSFLGGALPVGDIQILLSHCGAAVLSLIIFLITKP